VNQPTYLVLLAGTDTDIGKTWVGCSVATQLIGAGISVSARKPAQSFNRGDDQTDADLLAEATGESPHDVCPPHRWYEVAMAPFMAADALGRPPILLADLVDELTWPTGALGLLESAGGVRSPITTDGADTVSLAAAVAPDLVVLIAAAGLGTINAVRLSLDALTAWPTVVYLNQFDDANDLHGRNRTWLTANVGVPIVATIDDLAMLIVDALGTSPKSRSNR
jgi:dethiobiotin synthetase